MNWDAIGAVGEIIGAAAVVVSVFYLAAQVRKQTDEERLSATRELSELFLVTIGSVQEDKEFAEIYLRAVKDYDSVENADRIRVAFFFQRGFRILEQQHLHTKKVHLRVPTYTHARTQRCGRTLFISNTSRRLY